MESRQAVIQFRPGGVRAIPLSNKATCGACTARLRELLAGIEGYLLTGGKGGTPESDALVAAMEAAQAILDDNGRAAA